MPADTPPRKTPGQLRSARWFAPDDLRSFGHRSRAMQMGYGPEDWAGKPVIAIVNTWSDINPCHGHFKQRVDDVKRGVLQAGGFPLELPALSLADLPAGARLGTTSLRRTALARRQNPGLDVRSLRGNVPTRLRQLAAGWQSTPRRGCTRPVASRWSCPPSA